MRRSGSVLVVVLGLLAILAVIGVAFITMSALDRSTARSFALQTQMTLAADGAIEYVVHEMVLDVWEWEVASNKFSFTGKLLSGATNSLGVTCEPYDFPSSSVDAWLTAPIVSNATPSRIAFDENTTVTRFGIKFGKQTSATWPDNLGLPVTSPKANGWWGHELSFPFEQYLVRTSVTVLDHGALINLNAHGNMDTWNSGTGEGWKYDDCNGLGYFISDVNPSASGALSIGLQNLLVGAGAVPGRWGGDKEPLDDRTCTVLLENPGTSDIPFTLDEEFELRNMRGTYFKSRLENLWNAVDLTPATATPGAAAYTNRLKTTTVSWTAEVRGDGTASHVQASVLGSAWTGHAWSCPKPDLNTASADAIHQALRDSGAMPNDDTLKQFAANVVTFRRRGVANFTAVSVAGSNFYGAQRQPFFTEATCSPPVLNSSDPNNIKRTYTVKLEVYNPWPGDYDGDATGLDVTGLNVKLQCTGDASSTPSARAVPNLCANNPRMGEFEYVVTEFSAVCSNNKTLAQALQDIRLYKGGTMLDKISGTDLQNLQNGGQMSRKVYRTSENRGSRDNSDILILYVNDWQPGGNGIGTAPALDSSIASSAVPIRFPNCVPEGATDLPVRAPAGTFFKALARVGDLNQVLRFTPVAGGDPWIVTVSKTSRGNEANVKFNWMQGQAALASNVLSVGGPWVDDRDNDGDGEDRKDNLDKGLSNAVETAPPEFRVAGKINLNTATDATLKALDDGVGGISNFVNTVVNNRPFTSPAQILQYITGSGAGVEGRDDPFTRISNIATVRSDTFSIYGTVQIVNPLAPQAGDLIVQSGDVVRSRRFWALVDRSPALAFSPKDDEYIHPRILNFQWLD